MSVRTFKKDEWLDKQKKIQVFSVHGKFVTLLTQFMITSSWLEYMDDCGYELINAVYIPSGPYLGWDTSSITNFRKKA